tara:strand:- start:264 stop:461 length:198 start_codon:yes stop_codon:yes gene_type:complete
VKKVLNLAAVGLFSVSTSVFAGEGNSFGGLVNSAETEKPTITLAPGKARTKQAASTKAKTTKPGI